MHELLLQLLHRLLVDSAARVLPDQRNLLRITKAHYYHYVVWLVCCMPQAAVRLPDR